MIAIIDYGAGNLFSVKNALDFLQKESTITEDVQEIRKADAMILPGVGLSLDALTSRASQLGGIGIEAPKHLIGKNTTECMKSGIIYSSAASLDGIVERIEEEHGTEATVVATGGLAKKIIPYCKKKITLDEELLLKGLLIIYEKNNK